MRIRLLLETERELTIPWDYRTSLTKIVYEILLVSDPEYSHWLHEKGFPQLKQPKRVYRLFVYSDLTPTHWSLTQDGLLAAPWITWQIGSPDNQFIGKFIQGLEKKDYFLELFGASFKVIDLVRVDSAMITSGLVFHTISPIAAQDNPDRAKHPTYLNPNQQEFVDALERNLIAKWEAFHRKPWDGGDFGIRVWNPKQKLVPAFNIKVRAWHLHLQMWGADELIRFAYDAGLGIKNSQGFGMIEPGV